MKETPTTPTTPDNVPHPLRTLVADDSVVFSKSLCAFLKSQPLFQVVGTAMDGGEALHMAELLEPDLILMDLRMPVMDGLQAMAILRRRVPNMRIVIMTMEDSATAEAEARAHGAHGFIWKPRIMDNLVTELHRAFRPDHMKDSGVARRARPLRHEPDLEAGSDSGSMRDFHHRPAGGLTRIGLLLIWLVLAAAGRADNGLVAAYSFDEGTGTTVADASGNGNNGTINGATWSSAGMYGNALSFSGPRSGVTIPDSASLHLTTGMTLEAWVNPSTVNSGWRDVIYKGNDNYYLEASSSHNDVPGGGATFNGADDVATFGTAALAANIWTHLAVTYDGATVRLYVNGVQVASRAQTGDILTSANALQIGRDSFYGQYFEGMIDEVRVYNVALTAAQIQSDMNTPIGTVPGGLVAAYSFDEGTGTTVADGSGNGNDGTINGVTWTSAGQYGNGLVFDGTSALVTINDSASLHLTTGMTLEAWVNPSTVNSGWRDVIYKGNDNYYLEASSSHNDMPGGAGTFGGANVGTYGTTALTANTWTHLAVTYDGAMVRLYVNGVQVASGAQTGSILTSANALQIGGDDFYGQYFEGMIDEVRVYNVALTAAQIQSDMNTPIGTVPLDRQPSTVPNGVITSADSLSQITIRWNASSDSGGSVAGYRVYRNGALVATTQLTSYSDNGLSPSTPYCYTVVAFDSAGNSSSLSAQACATTPAPPGGAPVAPSNLLATAVTTTSVMLNWQDNSNNEFGFQIERAPAASGPWVVVGTAGANVTSYSDTGLSPATDYYYRVSAFN